MSVKHDLIVKHPYLSAMPMSMRRVYYERERERERALRSEADDTAVMPEAADAALHDHVVRRLLSSSRL